MMLRADRLSAAAFWIVGDDTGLSSIHLWAVMMGVRPARPYAPADPADLGRCLRLLRVMPEWRKRLPKMASESPYWAALVSRWDEVEASFLREVGSLDPPFGARADQTYALMKAIEGEVRTAQRGRP